MWNSNQPKPRGEIHMMMKLLMSNTQGVRTYLGLFQVIRQTLLCFCLGQRCRLALSPKMQAVRTPWLTPTLARSQKRTSEPEDASSTYAMIDTETGKIPDRNVWAWRYNQTMTIKGLHVKQDPRKECLSLKIQPNRPGVPSIQSLGNIAFFVWAINFYFHILISSDSDSE